MHTGRRTCAGTGGGGRLYFRVGLIEEFVKTLILVIVGRQVRPKTARQGALLGACVGAGFAAFESAGYAFNAALTTSGIDLGSLLQTEVMRSVLTPVGHVLWTALLGAVIFGAADQASARYRFTKASSWHFSPLPSCRGFGTPWAECLQSWL